MQMVVISSEVFFDGESAIINELFAKGMQYFHLRKPGATAAEICCLIDEIEPQFHSLISLHDYHHISHYYGIKRLHFNEKRRINTEPNEIEHLFNKGYILSTSVHLTCDLSDVPNELSYAFLSPVFDSISKNNYKGFSDDTFVLNNEKKNIKVIGLGGIDDSNVGLLKGMNFDGAAVLGFLWKYPENAVENFLKLIKHVN